MNFLMWSMFYLLKCFIRLCSMIFWTSCGCDTYRSWSSCTNWIFWFFMCRDFAALNIRVSSLAFSTSPLECLFPWFSQLFVLLWGFAIFNLEYYVLLFFCYPFKVWIWYLVVIYFLLISDMGSCCAFNYILELFRFVLLLCCYLCLTLSFLFNLLSIFFRLLFILCKLSSVKALLTCVGHPLLINSFPCQFCSGNNKSTVQRCFCPSVWACIVQGFLVLLIQDNVINLILNPDILLCYRLVLLWNQVAMCFAECWKPLFAMNLPFLLQNSTKLVPFWFCSPLNHCPIQLSGPVVLSTLLLKSPTSIVMDDGDLPNSLHSLPRFLYSFLISFGHFLARSKSGRVYVYDVDDILWLHLNFTNLDSTFPCWFALILQSISTGIRIPG